jgi:hypothetical protein
MLRQMRFRSRRKGGGFFVSDGNPIDVIPRTDRVCDSVKGVSGQSVDTLDARRHESVNQHICYSFVAHKFRCLLLVFSFKNFVP